MIDKTNSYGYLKKAFLLKAEYDTDYPALIHTCEIASIAIYADLKCKSSSTTERQHITV